MRGISVIFEDAYIDQISGTKYYNQIWCPGNLNLNPSDSMYGIVGEIYNQEKLCSIFNITATHEQSVSHILDTIHNQTETDEFFLGRRIKNLCSIIDGEFALFYGTKNHLVIARDPLGVRSLFYGMKDDRIVGCASEAKYFSLNIKVDTVKQFPPGQVWMIDKVTRHVIKLDFSVLTYPLHTDTFHKPNTYAAIRTMLYHAVKKRMNDQPTGFLLSGGLDSSILATIASEIMAPDKITTYSICIRGIDSDDVIYARDVAKHLNTEHIEIKFEVPEAFNNIPIIIETLESYDCSTIRTAVPMFMLFAEIAKIGKHKVVISGEGADELFGGYMYLHNAPSTAMFQHETITLLKNMHQFNLLCADRCSSAHGIEIRLPFLDQILVEYVTHVDACEKIPSCIRMEKMILRKSYIGFLPFEVLYRQHSNIGSSWVSRIKMKVESMEIDQIEYTENQPQTKEELMYRNIYNKLYPSVTSHNNIWRPKW